MQASREMSRESQGSADEPIETIHDAVYRVEVR